MTSDDTRIRASRVVEFRSRPNAHHHRRVRVHLFHPGDGILLTGFKYDECRLVSVRDLRQASRFPGNQAAIRSNDGQVGRRVLWPDRLRATKNGKRGFERLGVRRVVPGFREVDRLVEPFAAEDKGRISVRQLCNGLPFASTVYAGGKALYACS